jgi:hypothetical protein
MFRFLKPKRPSPDLSQYLEFKSPEAAFEFACQLHSDNIQEQSGHVAIVLDSRALLGIEEAVKTMADGRQLVTIKVASQDGGFVVPAQTAVNNAPALKPDDLVLWVAGKYMANLGKKFGDKRCAWVGLIYGVLSPAARIDTGEFRVALNYHDLPKTP